LLVPSPSHHPARSRLRFLSQALITAFNHPLHDVPPRRVQLLTQAVLEVTVADLVCENVDHHMEELQVSLTQTLKNLHGRPHLRSTMSTRPEQDGEVFFLFIPFHPLCYSNVTPLRTVKLALNLRQQGVRSFWMGNWIDVLQMGTQHPAAPFGSSSVPSSGLRWL